MKTSREPNIAILKNDFEKLRGYASIASLSPIADFLANELDRAHMVDDLSDAGFGLSLQVSELSPPIGTPCRRVISQCSAASFSKDGSPAARSSKGASGRPRHRTSRALLLTCKACSCRPSITTSAGVRFRTEPLSNWKERVPGRGRGPTLALPQERSGRGLRAGRGDDLTGRRAT
jgi:hypothetical protein